MKTKFALLLCLISFFSFAQNVTEIWSEDHIDPIEETSIFSGVMDNNDITYYAFEDSSGFSLAARNANGDEVYTVGIAGSGNEVTDIIDIAVDNINDYLYVVGTHTNTNRVGIDRFQKSTGAYLASFSSDESFFTISYGVIVDTNGDIIVASGVENNGFLYRITRFSMAGDVLWDNEFVVGDGLPRAVTIHPTNADIIIAGGTGALTLGVMSVSSSGSLNWLEEHSYNDEFLEAQSVIITSDNNIVISGAASTFSTGFIGKYDIDGNQLWFNQGLFNDLSFGVVELPDGSFISGGAQFVDLNTTFDTYISLTAYSSVGDFSWNYIDNDFDNGVIYEIELSSNNNLIAVGHRNNTGSLRQGFIKAYTINTLNIDDVDFKNSFDIYPNPANSELSITLANVVSSSLSYSVSNILGQQVISGPLDSQTLTQTISVDELASGTYIFTVIGPEGRFSRKLIVD